MRSNVKSILGTLAQRYSQTFHGLRVGLTAMVLDGECRHMGLAVVVVGSERALHCKFNHVFQSTHLFQNNDRMTGRDDGDETEPLRNSNQLLTHL